MINSINITWTISVCEKKYNFAVGQFRHKFVPLFEGIGTEAFWLILYVMILCTRNVPLVKHCLLTFYFWHYFINNLSLLESSGKRREKEEEEDEEGRKKMRTTFTGKQERLSVFFNGSPKKSVFFGINKDI